LHTSATKGRSPLPTAGAHTLACPMYKCALRDFRQVARCYIGGRLGCDFVTLRIAENPDCESVILTSCVSYYEESKGEKLHERA